jgi:oxygen-independent coproporphyrinogen-3 oxidase
MQEKTTVGNYFVANYPPFSFWNPETRGKALEALEHEPQVGTPLGLYVHIPFCRRRCHFCYFRVYTGREAKTDRVSRYVASILGELELYSRKPLLDKRRPSYVYFGGGTPSFLSPDAMTQLFDGMKSIMSWDGAMEVTFECEPGTLDEKKLDRLRELGVTRLSLGVEHFDDDILRANGRAHVSKEIMTAYEYARSIGFRQINVDLIAGMLNDTQEKWEECVRRALALEPECLTIYQMEIPFNTTIYQEMKERGETVAPVADWPTKRAWVDYAFSESEKAGYEVTSATTVVKDPQAYQFLYRDYLWQGADMISLGVASFGHFSGTHYQNEKDFGPYVERVEAGDLPIHRALAMSDEEKLIRELILQMKLGRLDRAYFKNKFATDIVERFSEPFEALREAGHLKIENGEILLTRQSLLRVDELLPAFFLPQHKSARYT